MESLASGYLLARHTLVRMYLFPLFDIGNGPNKPNTTLWNGVSIIGRGCRGALFEGYHWAFWHSGEVEHHSLTSFSIPGHVKGMLVVALIFLIEKWPAIH